MSARNFRSVGWVAGVAATALGCYMVNLKVASERAALEDVETRIVLAQRDIRVLQTEIGTRGRLAQLEKWNVKVLALSAPAANQFVEGSFQLATLVAPRKVIDPAAPVVLASAPAPERKPVLDSDGAVATPMTPSDLMHTASLKTDLEEVRPAPRLTDRPQPKAEPKIVKKAVEKPSAPAKAAADKAQNPAKAKADRIAAPAKVAAADAKPTKITSAAKTSSTKPAKTAAAKAPTIKAKPKDAKTEQ